MDELTARRTADLLTYDDIKLLGIRYCRAHLYRLIKTRKFPRPVRLSAGRVAFRQEDIRQWIRSRPSA
jgi:predicted DNA-binding transcriptional regulator AlpA